MSFDDQQAGRTSCPGTDNYQAVKLALGADGAMDNLVDAGSQAAAASIPVTHSTEDLAVHTAVKTALEIIDDWDASDHCNIRHLNSTDDAVVVSQGTAASLNCIEASAAAIKTAVELIDDTVYVDDADWTNDTSKHLLVGGVYQSSPHTVTDGDVTPFLTDSGGRQITKLAANSGVDIGDVDILSVIPGTGATNLGKAVSTALGATDTGVLTLAVRDDTLNIRSDAENDCEPLHTDAIGALWTRELATGVEDAGEAAGGYLMMVGAVRRDTIASSAGSSGDNATINTNANGALWCETVPGAMWSTNHDEPCWEIGNAGRL